MAPRLINGNACYLEGTLDFYREQKKQQHEQNKCLRKTTRLKQQYQTQQVAQSGDEILQKIQKLLESGFGVKRSQTQVEIHKEFIISCLPKIYQSVWARSAPSILKTFNVKQLIQEVLVVMPRRRGKTFSAAMFTAACLLAIPDCSCIIFSTGERTAKLLMTLITDLIEKAFSLGAVKREDYRFDTNNKECMIFYGPDGTKRSLMCLPGSVRVLFFFNFNNNVKIILLLPFSVASLEVSSFFFNTIGSDRKKKSK